MAHHRNSSSPLAHAARTAIIDAMREPPRTQDLTMTGLKAVMATRLLAVCNTSSHDPLLELTRRFACITTAKAFIAFANDIGACWPENVKVLRPCCGLVSPDEMTIARLADHARMGNRPAFGQIIDGLIRTDRHDRLYTSAAEFAVHLQ